MITFLRGNLFSKKAGFVTMDVQGVGYAVRVSNYTLDRIPSHGENLFLFIYHNITENDQQLFGFSTEEEKLIFELLISVKGVGPKIALALLSAMSPVQISEAIVQQNASLIAQGPGIGKKSAERIVLELKDKMELVSSDHTHTASPMNTVQNEVLSALEALGYPKNRALTAFQAARKDHPDDSSVSGLIKTSLNYLQR
ncbi:Holliday junction branch migration protein RuvA [Balneolaceae bacterium ANBcel3]|nr:Holliday junction branch migration protein RuvA [Balneolaceae bacterium ANBcel3]